MSFIVESLNCNGLGDRKDRRNLFKHLHRCKADIVLLQETHTTHTTQIQYEKEWKQLHPSHTSIWASSNKADANRSKGVAILIRDLTTTPVIQKQVRIDGRAASIQTSFKGHLLQLHSIYSPNIPKQRTRFFTELGECIYEQGDIIMGGDFNMVEDPNLDRRGGTRCTAHVAGLPDLTIFKTAYMVDDIWRQRNPTKRAYTRFSSQDHVASRLDRMYLSEAFNTKYARQTHTRIKSSDHSLVTLMLDIQQEEVRGSGYWMFNSKLVQDKEFMEEATQIVIEQNMQNDQKPVQEWWNGMKPMLQEAAVHRSVTLARESRTKIKDLQTHMENETDLDKKVFLKEMVADLKDKQKEGVMVRSKEETLVDGEKPNRYFYAREKHRKAKSTIQKLSGYNDLGEYVEMTSQDRILKEIHAYYTKLFKKQQLNEKLQDDMLRHVKRKLPRHVRLNMDVLFTEEELLRALKLASRNKSPGIDGFPYEFYLALWDVLKEPFTRWANEVLQDGLLLTAIQRRSIITLVHKKDSLENLDMWRPISLMCCDLKIITKALSIRLKRALPHIINREQTCGVEDRNIFDNLFAINDVIQHAEKHQNPAYILSFDFQKAFDKVDHNFLVKTLKAFGFGDRYINFINSTIQNCTATVANNGFFTAPVELGRGVKQGLQDSQLLYDIIGEVLAIQVQRNPYIRGYPLPGPLRKSLAHLQYADDNTFIVTTKRSIKEVFKELRLFAEATGCNINAIKTQGLTIGGAHVPGEEDLPFDDYPIRWNSKNGIEILGINFYADNIMTQKTTWDGVVTKVTKAAAALSVRRLSFKARKIIIQTKVMSTAWHVATVVKPSKENITKINTICMAYLYPGRGPETIKRKTLYKQLAKGGIGLINLSIQCKALRYKQVLRALQPEDVDPAPAWMSFARFYLAPKLHQKWPTMQAFNVFPTPMTFDQASRLHRDTPLLYYEASKFLHDNSEIIISKKMSTTKELYHIMFRKEDTVHIRGETYWNQVLDRRHTWSKIWANSFATLNVGPKDDVPFRLWHDALPTGEKLERCNAAPIHPRNCLHCGVQMETPKHLFMECQYAVDVWDKYMDVFKAYVPHITLSDVVLQYRFPKDPKVRKLLCTLSTQIIHEIWVSRNLKRKENITQNVPRSVASINGRIRVIHVSHRVASSDYMDTLCLPSPICHVEGNNLVFDLPEP